MEIFKNLFRDKGYIDGITIINLAGEILFTAKFNNLLNESEDGNCEIVGKNFFEIYDRLTPETSTIYRAMELGMPVYTERQRLEPAGKAPLEITSLSIPIRAGNRVVGAIDLSSQEREATVPDEAVMIDESVFRNATLDKLETGNSVAAYTLESILTQNEGIEALKAYVPVIAACDLPVMICGETGTGKELFAQAIHNASKRARGPFIAQNCASIPDTLLESILFGTSKGAFTGAIDNIGLLELAEGGTLFLDEINSMPIPLQAKLLRVLQDGYFRRVGGKEIRKADAKIISALNTEPMEAIRSGCFRSDLYYRLSTMTLRIPPLRERKEDIPLLVNLNICKYNPVFGKHVKYVSSDLYKKLMDYDWPGNIRELEHVIIYGLSMIRDGQAELGSGDIAYKLQEMATLAEGPPSTEVKDLRSAMEEYERRLIRNALNTSNGNTTVAAKMLNVPRQTLQRKVAYHNLR